jgi:hypothetical protein
MIAEPDHAALRAALVAEDAAAAKLAHALWEQAELEEAALDGQPVQAALERQRQVVAMAEAHAARQHRAAIEAAPDRWEVARAHTAYAAAPVDAAPAKRRRARA